MAQTQYINAGPIYLTEAIYEEKLAAGTLVSGQEYKIIDWEAQEKLSDEDKQAIADLHQDSVTSVNGSTGDVTIDLSGKQDNLVFNTEYDANNNKVATMADIPEAGELNNVDEVKVNGESVVTNKVADISVPTKTSDLNNDSGYITLEDTSGLQNKIEDIKVNGTSVVNSNKIAEINLTDTIGKDFTTNVTVGYLDAGTSITNDMTIGEILYKILYKESTLSNLITLVFGGLSTIPTSDADLDSIGWRSEEKDLDPDTLLSNGYTHNITTGDVEKEEGQYPTIAIKKNTRNIQLSSWASVGAEGIPYTTMQKVETDNWYIYYIPTLNYTEPKGANFVFTFKE